MISADLCYAFGPFRLLPNQRLLLRHEQPVAIGGRAFDLLVHLVENRANYLGKASLKQMLWPDQSVPDHNLAVHLSTLRKALGPDAARYIATVSGRGYRFVAPVIVAPDDIHDRSGIPINGTPVRTALPVSSSTHNLPAPLTQLIGREAEVQTVRALLRESRLVTLTGPGGIGKTQVALEVARRMVPEEPDGVWLVGLAAVTDPQLVPAVIAAALQMQLAGEESYDSIARFLVDRAALVLLDNCEHLLQPVATAAELILKSCPSVTILATSREPLRCEGERLHGLPPLALPPFTQPDAAAGLSAARLSVEEALAYPAVALLAERARFTLGRFEPADADAPPLVEICRRLDGIPLALELAAPLLGLMSPKEVAERLDDRFRLLTGGRRTALPRQQTLKAAIDWSYELLAPPEQLLFRRLAVFTGTWTLDAALAVVADDMLAIERVLPLLTALVDKSLVVVESQPPRTRYRFLETTRRYAAEQAALLDEPPRLAELSAWLLSLGPEANRSWQITGDETWVAHYAQDANALRTALTWCFEPGGDHALGAALVGCCFALWSALSLPAERHRWFARAIESITPATPPEVEAQLWLGWSFTVSLNDPELLTETLRAATLF